MFAPTSLDLKGLFHETHMFDSTRSWREAGFSVEGRGTESSIMVASHPSAPGYLFKRYSKKVSLKKQLRNYRRRVEGAEKLRAFVASRGLNRIAVPGKYMHDLGHKFSRRGVHAFVLVVERLPLLDSAASKQMYRALDDEGLRQLCVVLVAFRGLDSGVRNVPFTDQGQMAFIDTERWKEKKKITLKRIREYLSGDQRAFVDKFLKTQL
jgi:hypothetical protein